MLKQRLLFAVLLVAYMFSGVFEAIDNVLGLREFNFDSSAPWPAKVAKELVILLLLGVIVFSRR